MATDKITQTCSLTHCDLPHRANGYCNAHNQRILTHGERADLLKPIRHHIRKVKYVGCKVSGCDKSHQAQGFCQHHYERWLYFGDPLREPPKGHSANPWQIDDPDFEQFFWSKTVRTKKGCLEWSGAREQSGYGHITLGRKRVKTHRVAWQLANGREPVLDVLHHCDNPPCINPEHLYEGTDADNVRDCMERGRHWVPVGEEAKKSILKEVQVKEIRILISQKIRHIDIAKWYGVSKSAIGHISAGDSWKHLI